ncbi:MAG: ribosome recycling factor [candidate division Zixibacteria bacterium]|nr:ribosome recycling factor [candidate division Zixibacteria bacterium]
MLNKIYAETEEKMNKSMDSLRRELSGIRTGKATTHLLDGIKVEYYGSVVPLNQVAGVSAPEARLLVIQPWEKKMLDEVSKAIMKANLGLNPMNDGNVIRLAIPPLTEERRKELVKLVKNFGEEAKVAVRNIRREANEHLAKAEKGKEISEDQKRTAQEHVQKITDKFIHHVDELINGKEKEVLEV